MNVDPGEQAHGKGWAVSPKSIGLLNRRFGTDVELHHGFVQDAKLPAGSFDRVVSISTLEHVPEPEIAVILQEIRRLLRPGGLLVLTLDLFLDVHPFAEAEHNRYGKNVSARWLVEQSGLELLVGKPTELYGFPQFSVQTVLGRQSELLVGEGYPAMVQALVLRR